MTHELPRTLSDQQLLAETKRAAADARTATVALIALLAVLEERRLYLDEGCSSPFAYCTRVLRLSEHAAYGRIAAARTVRRFPVILNLLASGAINLTTVVLLARHLTPENHEAVLDAARHKSKSEVEQLMAHLKPQPDIASRVRKLTVPVPSPDPVSTASTTAAPAAAANPVAVTPLPAPFLTPPRATVAPLAPERYLIKVTVSREAHEKLRRAQDLLRHVIPSGDPAAVIERALTTLVDQLERTRFAQVTRPRTAKNSDGRSRHVPAAVRRVVWNRDRGRCAFVGTEGRCPETGFLEFHHIEPFSDGGPTTADNLSLRCRAHNAHEATRYLIEHDGEPAPQSST